MIRQRIYRLMQPGNRRDGARLFRIVHHAMAALGIAIMMLRTVDEIEAVYQTPLALGFYAVAAFFMAEYVLRLIAAPAAPGAGNRGALYARLSWAVSPAGLFDLACGLPGLLALAYGSDACLAGFIWAFKYIRYSPGLASLGRVIRNSRDALLSVLLGFLIALLTAASTAYLLERGAHPDHPDAFSSMPEALWWAIVTMTTTGYGDVVPVTIGGRILAGIVMVGGILIFALFTGILVTGYAEELRRRDFLRTWDLVARVPFFHNCGAALIAEVARLLRRRDYPAGAVIMRRGEPGDCMYFVAEGEVEIQLQDGPLFLGTNQFFGELALLTGEPRNATIVAARPCTLLALDIVDFHELLSRQPDLANIIREEARKRLGADFARHRAHPAIAADGSH